MRLWLSGLMLALLVAMSACDGKSPPPPPTPTLTLTGLDPCAERISVNIHQGQRNENRVVTVANGSAALDVGNLINLSRDLEITVRVLSVQRTEECAERNIVGMEYRFAGMLPAADAEGRRTLPAGSMTRSSRSRVRDLGDVRGGDSPPPRNRGDGSRGVVMWTEPRTGAACAQTCWEQWAQLQVFIVENGQETEVRNGQAWTDPAGRAQVYGQFGRDVPQGSNGNCFREDAIPNVPGRNGIVDAPGFDINVPTAQQILNAGQTDATGNVFTVSFRFTMRSVLICEAPPPRRTLGYYRWSARQDWAFSFNPDGSRRSMTTYNVDPPAWRDGRQGLEAGIQSP